MTNILAHNYLTITLPDGWEDASQVIAIGPEDSGFRPNLLFSQEPALPNETAEQFAARQLPQLQEVLSGYSVVSQGTARFGPNVGYLRQQSFSMEKGEIGQLQFYIVSDGRAYTFTFTHLSSKLPEVMRIAERVFSQARLNPPTAAASDRREIAEL